MKFHSCFEGQFVKFTNHSPGIVGRVITFGKTFAKVELLYPTVTYVIPLKDLDALSAYLSHISAIQTPGFLKEADLDELDSLYARA